MLQNRTVFLISTLFSERGVRMPLNLYERGARLKKSWKTMLLKLGGASIGLRTLLKNFSEALLPSYNAPFAGARSVIGKNEQKPKTTCANAIS